MKTYRDPGWCSRCQTVTMHDIEKVVSAEHTRIRRTCGSCLGLVSITTKIHEREKARG